MKKKSENPSHFPRISFFFLPLSVSSLFPSFSTLSVPSFFPSFSALSSSLSAFSSVPHPFLFLRFHSPSLRLFSFLSLLFYFNLYFSFFDFSCLCFLSLRFPWHIFFHLFIFLLSPSLLFVYVKSFFYCLSPFLILLLIIFLLSVSLRLWHLIFFSKFV